MAVDMQQINENLRRDEEKIKEIIKNSTKEIIGYDLIIKGENLSIINIEEEHIVVNYSDRMYLSNLTLKQIRKFIKQLEKNGAIIQNINVSKNT